MASLFGTLSHSETWAADRNVESSADAVFRYHMPVEPHTLDPAKLSASDANYFFTNFMRGLYQTTSANELTPEGAERCDFKGRLKLVCRLNEKVRWSDGMPVQAADYVRSFRRLLEPGNRNPAVELLMNIKNAKDVFGGRMPVEKLAVRASRSNELTIDFSHPDPDFLYKLTTSLLVPVRSEPFPEREQASALIVNGPYKIASWLVGRRVRFTANEKYPFGHRQRPPVEVLFVDDDQTALNLYEKGDLNFLRRLPTHYIASYRNRPDFQQIPVARFDYIGFGTELKDQPDLRAALSYSADFRELQKMYDALGIPGCPTISEELMDRPHCVTFDLEKAKAYWEKVPKAARERRYRYTFSKLGGDDVKRGAEWLQAQWKKNLGLTIDLVATEQGVHIAQLKSDPPPIFRKGVGLDRPTCLAALETFARGGSENFLKIDDAKYESLIEKISNAKSKTESKRLCGEGIQYLLDRHLLIPLGRIHFTLLVRPEFKGWGLNEMNQLDLAGLSYQEPHSKPR